MQIDRRVFMAGLGSAGAACLLPAQAHAQDGRTELVQKMRNQFGAPAAAGMLIEAGKVTFVGAAGLRRSDGSEPATTADMWHLGSNTKAMTASLYGRLVEQARAAWGATIPDLFPGVKIHDGWRNVTIEHLLSHTSGLSDARLADLAWVKEAISRRSPDAIAATRAELTAKALQRPPARPIGQYEYSNGGYIMVGSAIERLVGTSWEIAIAQQVFGPLGMTSAGFGAPTGANPWGHLRTKERLLPVAPTSEAADNPPALGPAGTVHCTLQDYAKFLSVFLGHGGSFLQPATIGRLTKPVSPRYALGWLVVPNSPWTGGTVIGHEGSNGRWHIAALLSPERGLAAVGVTNHGEEKGASTAQGIAFELMRASAKQ